MISTPYISTPTLVQNLIDRADTDGAIGIAKKDLISAYNAMPQTVRRLPDMIFCPSHWNPTTGKIYSLKGTDSDVTFSRTSLATFLDKDGVVKNAPHNLLKYSEDFGNAAWLKRGTCAVTPNDAIAPDGTTTADKIEGLQVGAAGDVYQLTSMSGYNGVSASIGFYIKRISTTGTLRVSNGYSMPNGDWQIDLSLLPDAWEYVTASHPAVVIVAPFKLVAAGVALQFQNGTAGAAISVHLWGAHVNTGGTLNKYIPTTATAVYGPRFEYDSNGKYIGLKIERAATNLFLNSLTPATQTRTVTNAAVYTISVRGSGSITLSGAATGSVTEGNPLTVTTTSTSLTLTVVGTLAHAQLELYYNATSEIWTGSSAVARAADVVSVAPHADWYLDSVGSMWCSARWQKPTEAAPFVITRGGAGRLFYDGLQAGSEMLMTTYDGVNFITPAPIFAGAFANYRLGWSESIMSRYLKTNDSNSDYATATYDGAFGTGDIFLGAARFCGHVKSLAFWKTRVSDTDLSNMY